MTVETLFTANESLFEMQEKTKYKSQPWKILERRINNNLDKIDKLMKEEADEDVKSRNARQVRMEQLEDWEEAKKFGSIMSISDIHFAG